MKIRNNIIIYLIVAFMFVGCYKKQKEDNDLTSLLYLLAFEPSPNAQAAIRTATNNCNCTRITPFYWEIGNANGKIVSGKFPNAFNSYP